MGTDTICVLRAFDESWANPCKIRIKKRSPSMELQKELVREHSIKLER